MERPAVTELIPAIVQDAASGRVLMLAWMDEEALRRTRETGEAWFWSRSRQEYWHKGATSGNTMAVVEVRDDCDGDAILVRVDPAGPACHTGAESCFAPWLWRIVAERAATRPAGLLRRRPARRGPPPWPRKWERRASRRHSRPSRTPTSVSSRSSPTCGSTATSCSLRGGSIPSGSRRSSAAGTPAEAREATGHSPAKQPRDDVVQQPQRHAPEDMALDVDPLDVQRLRKAQRTERAALDARSAPRAPRTAGVCTPTTSSLRCAPLDVRPSHGAEERVYATPVACVSIGSSAARTVTGRARARPPPRASRSAVARRSSSAGSGLSAGEAELAAVEAAVVDPDDEHDPELALVVPVDGREHRGGRDSQPSLSTPGRSKSSTVSRFRISRARSLARRARLPAG